MTHRSLSSAEEQWIVQVAQVDRDKLLRVSSSTSQADKSSPTRQEIEVSDFQEKYSEASYSNALYYIHSEQPDLSEIEECFREVRKYYKNGLKSWNKVYDPSINSDAGKTDKRNENSDLSRNMSYRQNFSGNFLKKPFEEIGKNIYEQNAQNGNCTEMSSLAAFIMSSKFPKAKMHLIRVRPPGDHAFLLVGELPATGPIDTWKNLPLDMHSYVMDVWLNVCCHISVYPTKAEGKLNKWFEDGKKIITGIFKINDPNSQEYRNAFFKSEIEFYSTGDNLHSVI